MSWIIAWLNSKFYLTLTIGKSFLPLGNEVHPPKPPPPSPKFLSLTPYLYLLPFSPLLYFINPLVPGVLRGDEPFDQLRVIRSIKGDVVWPQAVFDTFYPGLFVMSYIGFTLFRCPNHLILCLWICCTGGKLSISLIFSLPIYCPTWFYWSPCVNIPFHWW